MTDTSEDFSPALPDAAEYLRPDSQLVSLVYMANRGFGIPVTLNCAGRVVSGNLCSPQTWLEAIAAGLTRSQRTADASAAEAIQPIIEHYEKQAAAAATEWTSPGDPGRFDEIFHAHMIDARVDNGPVLPTWRGRIAQVSDWSLGF